MKGALRFWSRSRCSTSTTLSTRHPRFRAQSRARFSAHSKKLDDTSVQAQTFTSHEASNLDSYRSGQTSRNLLESATRLAGESREVYFDPERQNHSSASSRERRCSDCGRTDGDKLSPLMNRPALIITDPDKLHEICMNQPRVSREQAVRSILVQNGRIVPAHLRESEEDSIVEEQTGTQPHQP